MQNINLDPAPSKKIIAYNGIKQLIKEGTFARDTPLVERQLCEVLEVSRTPVREALRELANEGLVEIIEGKGVYVKRIDYKDMIEIFELREALEMMTIKLFLERAGQYEVQRFEELMEEQEEAYQKEEHAKFMKNDMKLHNLIAEGAQNSRIRQVISNIYDQIQQMAISVKDDSTIRDMAIRAHRSILEAIKAKDVEQAQKAMAAHVVEVKEFYKDKYYLL